MNSSWFLIQLRTPWRHNEFLTMIKYKWSHLLSLHRLCARGLVLLRWYRILSEPKNSLLGVLLCSWCRRFWMKQGKSPAEYICMYISVYGKSDQFYSDHGWVEKKRHVCLIMFTKLHNFYSKSEPRNLPPTAVLKPVIYHHFYPFPVWVLLQPALHWAAFFHHLCR